MIPFHQLQWAPMSKMLTVCLARVASGLGLWGVSNWSALSGAPGLSGFLYLVSFTLMVGAVALFVLRCMEGSSAQKPVFSAYQEEEFNGD